MFVILFEEMKVARRFKLRDSDVRGHSWTPLIIQFVDMSIVRGMNLVVEWIPSRGIL